VPELPEVDAAARVLRTVALGKTIAAVERLHRVHRRLLPPSKARRLVGAQVVSIERRGKHQLIRLGDGSTLHVHFRMTGDWEPGLARDPLPPYTRVAIDFTDGARVALTDPRALSTLTWHAPGVDPLPDLGPDATDPAFTPAYLADALSKRRIAIKPALLDQRVVAGLGNIYATEALWLARIDPRRPASSLEAQELSRLVKAIRRVLDKGEPWSVYDREGQPCPRCRTTIQRITQAGRSTYWCPGCQGSGAAPQSSARRARGARSAASARRSRTSPR
jgi:formamidopyrimidine-DNA glycosylase